MASLWTTWQLLEQEVVDTIEAITPNARTTYQFKARSISDRKANDNIESVAGGTPRIFQIETPSPTTPNITMGHTERTQKADFAVLVSYPNDPVWRVIACDDIDKIAHTFRRRSWTTANVSFVDPDIEADPTIDPVGDDEEHFTLRLPVFSLINIS